MQYRKLSPTGDYVFGQGSQSFCTGIDAVRQLIQTRLQLVKGTWWRDISAGFDLYSILGASGSPENLAAADSKIRQVITGTDGVKGIVSFSSSYDPSIREYSYTAQVQTDYSTTVISGVL